MDWFQLPPDTWQNVWTMFYIRNQSKDKLLQWAFAYGQLRKVARRMKLALPLTPNLYWCLLHGNSHFMNLSIVDGYRRTLRWTSQRQLFYFIEEISTACFRERRSPPLTSFEEPMELRTWLLLGH